MRDIIGEKLASLGFALPEGSTPPSESLVREFEDRFGVALPPDFRSFLVRHGGARGTAVCPLLEPTPFGTDCCIDCFFGFENDEIGDSTEIIEGAPDIIAIGYEPGGKMWWLFCSEPYLGHVFVHDHQGRSAWPDDQFFQWFPNLAPEIKNYLDLRRNKKLPSKPVGFEHVYLAARSFSEFVDRLRPYAEEV